MPQECEFKEIATNFSTLSSIRKKIKVDHPDINRVDWAQLAGSKKEKYLQIIERWLRFNIWEMKNGIIRIDDTNKEAARPEASLKQRDRRQDSENKTFALTIMLSKLCCPTSVK